MQFVLHCTDRADAGTLRQEVRPAHLEYLTGLGKAILMAGPMLVPDGSRPLGSLLIVEAADQAAADAMAAHDPYAKAGLFQAVTVTPFRTTILNPPVL